MRIDGKAFLVVLGLGTLALAVSAVWIWPRLAGHGVKVLTGRIAVLLATQLSVAATLLFTVNALGGFYTSWGQLFGTDSAKYTVTDRGPADAARYDERAVSGGGGGGGVGGVRGIEAIEGLRSGLTAGLQVYPPGDYASRRDRHRDFPVEVVDLTGGTPGLSGGGYQQVADTYQVVVVVVTGGAKAGVTSSGAAGASAVGPSAGSASATSSSPGANAPTVSAVSAAIPGVNVPDGEQGRLFWAQDLRAALCARYRLDRFPLAWGVAGYGQDGAAAVNLAVQDPGSYGLAAAGGDWTHTDPRQSWPGIDTYLTSVPLPDAGLLYDPSAGGVPARLAQSSGSLRITRQPGLTLAAELAWLGTSIDVNTGVRA